MIRRIVGITMVGVALAACRGGDGGALEPGRDAVTIDQPEDGAQLEEVVWDFTSPRTAAELGSRVDDFVQLDGPAALRVVFPSGREIEGTFGRGALGETARPPTAGFESGVINQVILLEESVASVDGLRASADRFEAEWGPAIRPSNGESITDLIDAFASFMESADGTTDATLDFENFAAIGDNVKRFDAAESDGVQPAWIARFTFDTITIRVALRFDPGVP